MFMKIPEERDRFDTPIKFCDLKTER